MTVLASLAGMTPAYADFATGAAAYQNADYVTAAREWLPLAKQGNAVAQFNMGILYYGGLGVVQDRAVGRDYWLASADKDYIPAFYQLALTEMDGYLARPDFEDARALLSQASDAGYAPAQYFLANLLRLGLGGDKDSFGAAALYQSAAKAGNPNAAFALGEFARLGTDAKTSPADAFLWYEAAAKKGQVRAQYRLGWCYQQGFGTAPDMTQAYVWFAVAAAHGHYLAGDARDAVTADLTPEQMDSANQQLATMGIPLPHNAADEGQPAGNTPAADTDTQALPPQATQ